MIYQYNKKWIKENVWNTDSLTGMSQKPHVFFMCHVISCSFTTNHPSIQTIVYPFSKTLVLCKTRMASPSQVMQPFLRNLNPKF